MFGNLQLEKFPSFLSLVFLLLPSQAAQGFSEGYMVDIFNLLTTQQSCVSLFQLLGILLRVLFKYFPSVFGT